jgi:hypothetical protein
MQALRGNMKSVFLGIILMAFNANAADAPKADDKKKPERSAVPERITRPKATPESLPQPLEKKSALEVCPKYEYKERDSKIVCLIKPAGGEKPKPAAK